MRFDVIVGNPPYQQSGSKNTIYQHFYNRALEISDIVSLITPKNMIDSLTKGNCDGVKIKITKPRYINYNNIEQYFDAASTFCYFIIEKNYQGLSQIEMPYGLIQLDPTKIKLSDIDTQEKSDFVAKHFNNQETVISTADASNNTTDGTDLIIFDTIKNGVPQNIQHINKPNKRWSNNPYKPKVLFNIYSSGKQSEAYLDLAGNILPSSKHCMAYILFDTPQEAQQAYDSLNQDTFKEYVRLFQSRSTIWEYFRNVTY